MSNRVFSTPVKYDVVRCVRGRRRARPAWRVFLLLLLLMLAVLMFTGCQEVPGDQSGAGVVLLLLAAGTVAGVVWACLKQAENDRRLRRVEEFELWDNGNFVHAVGEVDEVWSEQRAIHRERMAAIMAPEQASGAIAQMSAEQVAACAPALHAAPPWMVGPLESIGEPAGELVERVEFGRGFLRPVPEIDQRLALIDQEFDCRLAALAVATRTLKDELPRCLPLDDLVRILQAVQTVQREVRSNAEHIGTMCSDDEQDLRRAITEKLSLLTGCVGGLLERLEGGHEA